MKYFQLFTEKPNIDFMTTLVRCFGLESIDDSTEFSKVDLININTVTKLEDLIPELIIYYLPCKSRIYLSSITIKRTITILSQFLKLYDYKLCRKEKIVDQNKMIYYNIFDNKLSQLRITQERAEVNFT